MVTPPIFSASGLLLLTVFVLSACSILDDIPWTAQTQEDWIQYQHRQGMVNDWDLHARAIIFADGGAYSVGLNWKRQQNFSVLIIEAPLGQGLFRLESSHQADGPVVQLRLPDRPVIFAESAEAALQQALGWSIPVRGLTSWIKGLPEQLGDYRYDLNGDGRLRSMEQNGWTIQYQDYFDFDSAEQGLPKKIHLEHDKLALKIVIDRWQALVISRPDLFPNFD